MNGEKRHWRFFTRLEMHDTSITEHWCWERLAADGGAVATGSGFKTLPSAISHARAHGFTGDPHQWPEIVEPRRTNDWSDATVELGKLYPSQRK